MLTDMHISPAEGNFCDEYGKAWKLSLLKAMVNAWATSAEELNG